MRRVNFLATMAAVGVLCAWATPAVRAGTILTNFNTTVTIADDGANPGHTISSWTVDGVGQYVTGTGSWFYRVGNGPVVSLDTAAFVSKLEIDNSGDPFDFSPTTLNTVYQDTTNGLQFSLQYQVSGGNNGSGVSSIQAQLTAQLISPSAGTALSIFELNNLGVGGSEVNDLVTPSAADAAGSIAQSDANGTFNENTKSRLTGPNASPTVSDPTHRQAGLAASVAAAVAAGLLNDTPGGGVAIGPSDVAFAYQYDFSLATGTPSQSVELDVNRNLTQNLTPEPASLTLLGLGGLLMLRRQRRKA
jgi:hypothetical protein